MKNRLIALGLACSMLFLSGCGSQAEINNLNSMGALNSESSVSSSYKMSSTDEQNMVYAQVSSRQLLDLSVLEACTDNEAEQVMNYMNQIDNQLVGKINTYSYDGIVTKSLVSDMIHDNAVIDTYMTDYLLAFFERTPYYWQRTKTTIRGIDPSSRSIIVDVAYKTIDFEKSVKPDSTIVRGEPSYDTLMQTRYNKWIQILSTELNNPNNSDLPEYKADFERYYGDPEEIIAEQRVLSNTEAIYETGDQQTYSGVINSDAEKSKGTCSVRYILIPNYALGINLGLTCEHMYITDFKLDDDVTADLTTFTAEGYATVADSVYNLIYRYFTCLDESDFSGLYKLTTDFQTLDKYYEDMFDSTYQKHDGFSVSLFDITGTHITCGVTISTKERAKNSNMTFPVYTDKYYIEIELVEDELKIDNMVHLSRTLEGEPNIDTDEADITGFSATIDLSNEDKIAIENLICEFGALQLLGENGEMSDDFNDVVDISISTNQLSSLKTNMYSVNGARKVVFLQNYQQGTSNYASVKCRELSQDDTNAVIEMSTTYEFILKGNRWYVYNYDVNSSVRLDTTNLNTTGCLCLVSPGKVEAYTSQVKSTASTSLDEVSDTSISIDHEEYMPVLKTGSSEQGYNKLAGVEVSDSIYNEIAASVGIKFDYDNLQTYFNTLRETVAANPVEGVEFDVDDAYNFVMECVAVVYNINDSRYMDGELEGLNMTFQIAQWVDRVNAYSSTSSDLGMVFKDLLDVLSQLERRIG